MQRHYILSLPNTNFNPFILMRKILLLFSILFVITSCQKMPLDENESGKDSGKISVKFNISQFEQLDFSTTKFSRSTDIANICTHICLGVYKDGTRIEQVNKKSSDDNFNQLSVSLEPGTYRVVILAHSDSSNPTMTKPEKITFGKGMTDTFYWSQDVTVDKNTELDIHMRRAVAMFRLVTTDNIPSEVKSMKFYYTGGSSTIDGLTGYGNVNSKQTEIIDVDSNMSGSTGTFEVYTFPKEGSNTLKIEVSALDASGNVIIKKTFEDVPIKVNQVTQYKGEFFGGTSTSKKTSFRLSTDDEWQLNSRTF